MSELAEYISQFLLPLCLCALYGLGLPQLPTGHFAIENMLIKRFVVVKLAY